MKYFFDTEFIEHEHGIDLISIGIVREDGETFYRESSSYSPALADNWVRENVYKHLNQNPFTLSWDQSIPEKNIYPESIIKEHVIKFIGRDSFPEFYAYYADYDWVVFARLFGKMIDLSEKFPMWCIDLKQMMWERELDDDWKKIVCPDPKGEHNALVDAKWNLQLYKEIKEYDFKDRNCHN